MSKFGVSIGELKQRRDDYQKARDEEIRFGNYDDAASMGDTQDDYDNAIRVLETVGKGGIIKPEGFPTIVCLCGSTRFGEAYKRASLEETLGGKIVLSIGCNLDDRLFDTFTQDHKKEIKTQFDELHKRKIDLADEVLILNVGGYVGESTRSEIRYALEHGKPVRWLEPIFSERTLRAIGLEQSAPPRARK